MSDQETSNHIHHYEIKGSSAFWAECECGEKLSEGNGPVVGSQAKVMRAVARALISREG